MEIESTSCGLNVPRTYTKHGLGSMDQPMDHPMDHPMDLVHGPLHGPGPWTTSWTTPNFLKEIASVL